MSQSEQKKNKHARKVNSCTEYNLDGLNGRHTIRVCIYFKKVVTRHARGTESTPSKNERKREKRRQHSDMKVSRQHRERTVSRSSPANNQTPCCTALAGKQASRTCDRRSQRFASSTAVALNCINVSNIPLFATYILTVNQSETCSWVTAAYW